MGSRAAATNDNNGNVWLFGDIAQKLSQLFPEMKSLEKLPEPLNITPVYATCDEDGMISVHGSDYSDEVSAFSIDSNARSSTTSLRGILDLGFILVSLLILSIMGWNITDVIRKGEVF